MVTTRQISDYGIDPGVPVDIGSTKCAADYVATYSGGPDYVVIYGPDGRKLSGTNGGTEMFFDATPDSLKKLSKTAVCYPASEK